MHNEEDMTGRSASTSRLEDELRQAEVECSRLRCVVGQLQMEPDMARQRAAEMHEELRSLSAARMT